MSRPDAQLSVAAPGGKTIGSSGDNPEVSRASRFRDDTWDLSNEILSPTTDKSSKLIRWAFVTPDGGQFTDPRFRTLLHSSKQFIYALLWHPIDEPPFAASAARQLFWRMKHFIVHLLSYRIRSSDLRMF